MSKQTIENGATFELHRNKLNDMFTELYNFMSGAGAQLQAGTIALRDAINIPKIGTQVFVINDGDGKWALYQATTTGVGATFVKLSDPDLLNAVMSNATIKAAYESNPDTNALTNALKLAYDNAVLAIGNKVDKETGKSLLSDTEIARLLTLTAPIDSNLGLLKTTDTPPPTGTHKGDVATAGTYTNFITAGATAVVFTAPELADNYGYIYVVNNVATKSLVSKKGDTYNNGYKTAVNPTLGIKDNTLISSTGSEVNNVDYECTDFIAVNGSGARITISTGMSYTIAQVLVAYDKNKIFLSIIEGSSSTDKINQQYTQPLGCAFIRVTNKKSKGITLAVKIEENVKATTDAKIQANSDVVGNIIIPNVLINSFFISITGSKLSNPAIDYSFFNVVPREELVINAKVITAAVPIIVFFDKFNSVLSFSFTTDLNYAKVVIPLNCFKIAINNNPSLKTLSVERQPMSYAQSAAKVSQETTLSELKDANLFYEIASGVPSYNIDNETVGIIVSGQSNAEGRAPLVDFPAEYSKTIATCNFNFNDVTGNFSPLNVTGQWGFDAIVYNKIATKLGAENFYVVKRTRGGTSVAYQYNTSFNADIKKFENDIGWESQLYYLEKSIRSALAANPNIKFKAILWHQGESDSNNEQYFRDLARVIMYIRGIVKNPVLPFIYGTIPTNSLSYAETTYNAFVKIQENLKNCYMIDMGNKSLNADNVHFNATTAKWLGEQMWTIMDTNTMIRRKS